MARRASIFALALACVACGERGDAVPDRDSKSATASPAKVGYDVRRLRPRDGEALDAMFARLAAASHADGKNVAVLFSADWCEPCRRLELELGNEHAPNKIGGFRILELKEEDWMAATRMSEFNALRKRWYDKLDSYPVFLLLDENDDKVEEMKEAIERLSGAGIEPTVDNWFENVSSRASVTSAG